MPRIPDTHAHANNSEPCSEWPNHHELWNKSLHLDQIILQFIRMTTKVLVVKYFMHQS